MSFTGYSFSYKNFIFHIKYLQVNQGEISLELISQKLTILKQRNRVKSTTPVYNIIFIEQKAGMIGNIRFPAPYMLIRQSICKIFFLPRIA